MSTLLRQQLVTMRENAKAIMATADAILTAMEPAVEPGCQHAQRQSSARMGHPNAWRCPACGAEGEGGEG